MTDWQSFLSYFLIFLEEKVCMWSSKNSEKEKKLFHSLLSKQSSQEVGWLGTIPSLTPLAAEREEAVPTTHSDGGMDRCECWAGRNQSPETQRVSHCLARHLDTESLKQRTV